MTTAFNNSLGYIAAILTTSAFIPQVYRSWRTHDMSGISLPMYAMFTSGVALWMVYGYLISSTPVLIANIITLLLAGIVLTLKIRQVLSIKK